MVYPMKVFMTYWGWCMWHTMHWLVGIARVKAVLERMPGLVLVDGRVDGLRLPSLPNCA